MKKMQKTCAVALAFSMILTSAAVTQSDLASAAKLKLSKTKATLKVGKSLKLKVKGAKKAKWSSSNSGVASVSSKGVVKAKSVGSAKITAKVKKKKLTCKITVKSSYRPANTNTNIPVPTAVPTVVTPAPTPVVTPAPNVDNNTNTISGSTLAQNLGVVTQQLSTGQILFTVTNNNSIVVPYYTINFQLKSSDDKVLTSSSVVGYALNPGESQYLTTTFAEEGIVDVSKSTIAKSVDTEMGYVSAPNSVSVTLNTSSDGASSIPYTATATDTDARADIICLFYDASGKIIGVEDDYLYFTNSLTIFGQLSIPRELTNYDIIKYSSAKVFVYPYKFKE